MTQIASDQRESGASSALFVAAHLAIVGGLLAIAAAGPGSFSRQPREHSS
jgi:hypothetical protein